MFFRILYKIIKRFCFSISNSVAWVNTYLKFKLNGVKFFNDFKTEGSPIVNINLKGKFVVGHNIYMNNGKYANMIGRQQQCYFIAGPGAELVIGNNVGISCSAIICNNYISIGDNVKIGGNTAIYDSDFHSLNSAERNKSPEDLTNIKTKPIIIGKNVFIGASSTILKGVTIGENSIIGACSVVAGNIPENQIWAGNPAKFIRNI
ncbi:MAG: hypothetical protein JWQ57_3482 [Mucilaginibacter sp.]|nr:hypothetical protein [Mucilaginibacter sp.]